ncbi:MAG: hypothetical protein ACU85U_15315 [Gammaproteobacteria bacterium]|jgi:hypothetical protein
MDIKRIQPVPVVQPSHKVEREAEKNEDRRNGRRKRRKPDDTDDGTKRIDTYA